jgi:hypothetical protein
MLRNFSPEKSDGFGRERTRVPEASMLTTKNTEAANRGSIAFTFVRLALKVSRKTMGLCGCILLYLPARLTHTYFTSTWSHANSSVYRLSTILENNSEFVGFFPYILLTFL